MKHFLTSALLFLVATAIFTTSAEAATQQPKHKHALARIARTAAKPFTATAGHPVRTFKQVLGSVAFAAEAGVDLVHGGFAGLDQATANQEYFGVIHLFFAKGDALTGKIDLGLEKAEDYFFGQHEFSPDSPAPKPAQ